MFGSLVGRLFGNAAAAAKRIENTDLMQAVVGCCLLVASAGAGEDGDPGITEGERAQIEKQLRASPNLAHFGAEINKTLQAYTAQLDAGFRLGRLHIMKEIREVAHNPAHAEEVFVNALMVAEAEGGVSEAEKRVLQEIGRELNINLKQFNLA